MYNTTNSISSFSTVQMEHHKMKLLSVGVLALAFDRIMIGESDWSKSLLYAGCVAGSAAASETIIDTVAAYVPGMHRSVIKQEKDMIERALELTTVAATTHVANGWVLGNESGQSSQEHYIRLTGSAGCDILGELVSNYVVNSNQPVV